MYEKFTPVIQLDEITSTEETMLQELVALANSTTGQYIIKTAGSLVNTTAAWTVPYGGTGVASFTAYAILAGGLTSTGALQQVPSIGTTGQVLTSNGAGTLPTWQTAAGGGADTALSNLASVAINASLVLGSSDGGALGSASKMWSDLFLASGGIIDFNGDVTITHTANTLTFAGASSGYTFDDDIIFPADAVPTNYLIKTVNQTTNDKGGNPITIDTGDGLGTGTGGGILLLAGTGGVTDGQGGAITLRAGAGQGAGAGALLDFGAGAGGENGNGGGMDFDGGEGGINGGVGGSLNFNPGYGPGGNGTVNIADGNSGIQAIFSTASLATSNKTFTFPNATGTFVLLDATQTLTAKTLTSPVLTTPSAFTTGGTITLAENTSIALDPAGSADGKYSGITVAGTAGATLVFGDLIYLDPTDSRWELTDANAAAAADGDARGMIGICVLAAAADGSATTILLQGIIRADAVFPALTINAPVYVSETAGDIVVAQPTTTDAVIRVLGFAITADEIYFNPSSDYITHA